MSASSATEVKRRRGAVVLCGGGSKRMGRDKAMIEIAGQPMLTRVVQAVAQVVPPGNIVCAAAQGQPLSALPSEVTVQRDQAPDCGPLSALSQALEHSPPECDALLAVGCDAPLLSPALAKMLFNELGVYDAVVPCVAGRPQPLVAVYSRSAGRHAERLLASGSKSLMSLLDALAVHTLREDVVRAVDPGLSSFLNVNDEAELARVLREFT